MKPESNSRTEQLLQTLRGTPWTCASPLRLLTVAAWLSVSGCQEDPATHHATGPSAGGVGNVPGQAPGTDVKDVNRATEYEAQGCCGGPKVGREPPAWNEPASLGTVRGRVFDAVTGSEVTGSVFTTAMCTGDGCAAATGDTQGFVTPLEKGVFSFEAAPSPESKLKPALLKLSPYTAFTITAKDYQPLVIAHGPRAEKKTDAHGQPFTELPALYLCPNGADDNDGDGICNAAEARYKTNPDNKDEDEDALSDSLEFLGHPAKDDNTIYDIRSLKADPHKRDIFVAVRYTASSQAPSQKVFTLVKQAFEDAPSPKDGIPPGIHLHILSDERRLTGNDDVKLLDEDFVKFRELTDRYYDPRPLAFHYGLFADRYGSVGKDTSSGISNGIGAAEFIVTLGAFPNATDLQQAGTFMHELGHNLGLMHGGNDHEHFKPAYFSIMNYAYQMDGIERASGTVLDYARFTLKEIDETQVNEERPFVLGPSTNDEGQLEDYRNPRVASPLRAGGVHFPRVEGNLAGPLDLNLNGRIEPDVCTRFSLYSSRGPRVYEGEETRNDWATLNLGGGDTGRVGDVPVLQSAVRAVDKGPMTPCRPAIFANVVFAQPEPDPDWSASPGGAADEQPQSWPEYAPPAAPKCWMPGTEPVAAPTQTPEPSPGDDSPTSPTDTSPTSPTDTGPTSPTDTGPTSPTDTGPISPTDTEPGEPSGPNDTDPNGSKEYEEE